MEIKLSKPLTDKELSGQIVPKLKLHKQLILVEFRNTCPFIYKIQSKKPITIEAIVEYFKKTFHFNEEKDSIVFVDDPTIIKI